MSELATKCLRNAGATRLRVMNRTQSKADELASKLGAKAVAWEDHLAQLKSGDIVVCSMSSPSDIVSYEEARSNLHGSPTQASSSYRYGCTA